MSSEPQDHPEDEFDVAGRERGPQGAHRTPRPLWRTLLPFVLVIIAAPLLAWGAVSVLNGADGPTPQATTTEQATPGGQEQGEDETTDGGSTPTEDAPAEQTSAPEEESPEGQSPDEGETTDEEETTAPPTDANLSATVSVLNGAGIDGLAGQTAGELTAEGFTQVSAGNYGAAAPQTTTLYYNNATLQATAQAIGDILGITDLVEAPGATQNVDIAIVLRTDYSG